MKKYIVGMIICLVLIIQGCASPSTLKPVAVQNQQNLGALSNNVQILLALYEPLLQASSQSLIYQHIGKTEQEMIAVVGAPMLPPPAAEQTWEQLFTKAAQTPIAKREKYLERYQLVQLAQQRGMEQTDLETFKREGWIYQAATDETFTPQQAHLLLTKFAELKKANSGSGDYFAKAEQELKPYDPMLQLRRASVDEAQRLFAVLKQEITTQLNSAATHSQAIASFAEIDINVEKTFQEVIANKEQLTTALNRLSQARSENISFRDAAIDLLTKKLGDFISK